MTKLGCVANITKLAGFEHTKYIQGNCSHIRKNDDYIPLFIGKTVRNGQIDFNFDWYIPLSLSQTLPRSQLRKKCIVLPYVGSVGDLAIFNGKYLGHLGSNIAKIELNDSEKYTTEFVYYFLKSPYGQKKLLKDIQGGVQKNITMEAIRNVELPDTSIEDQIKISSILIRIDNQIKKNNDLVQKLQVLAQATFNRFFSSENNLISLVDFPYIKVIKPGIIKFDGKKHYIATAEITGEEFNYNAPLIEYESRENRANMQPTSNSVWFAKMKNSIKHIYVTCYDKLIKQNYIFSTRFCGITCEEFAFEYMINYLNLSYFEKKKDITSHGATMEGINNEDLKSFKIHLPTKDKLVLFHNKSEEIYYEISRIRQVTFQLNCLKKKLLPLLINSQLQ